MRNKTSRLLLPVLALAMAFVLTGCDKTETHNFSFYSIGDYFSPKSFYSFSENRITELERRAEEEKANKGKKKEPKPELTPEEEAVQKRLDHYETLLSYKDIWYYIGPFTPNENASADPGPSAEPSDGSSTSSVSSDEEAEAELPVIHYEKLTIADALQFSRDESVRKAQEMAEKKKKEFDSDSVVLDPAPYDVIYTSGTELGELIEAGYLMELDLNAIPNAGVVNDEYKNPAYDPNGKYTITTTWQYMGLLIDAKVAGTQINSWDALFSEDYAGKIIMPGNMQDCLAVTLLSMGEDVNTTDQKVLKKAFKKLKKQKPLVKEYSNRNAHLLMQNDEASIYPCYSGDALAMMEKNPNLIFMLPDGGTFRTSFGFAVSADTVCPEDAMYFINEMCAPKVQAANAAAAANYAHYATTSEAVKDELAKNKKTQAWTENFILYPPESLVAGTPLLNTLPKDLRQYCHEKWDALTAEKAPEAPVELEELIEELNEAEVSAESSAPQP